MNWFALALAAQSALHAASGIIAAKSAVHFRCADRGQGARILGRRDVFVRSLSAFDRSARLRSAKPVSTQEFLRFVTAQAMDWTGGEKAKLTAIEDELAASLEPYARLFPKTITLVKTTGREEGDATYTRDSSIILPESYLNKSAAGLKKILVHELFHVMSRHHPKLRRQLYALIGFHPCNPVLLPPELAPRRITNPDAPLIEDWIQVEAGGEKVKAVPILFSRSPRFDPSKARGFFDQMEFRLMVVERTPGDWKAALRDGQPRLLKPGSVSGYWEQIGRNTGYIIHPDEILADNFVCLVLGRTDIPNPEIPQKMGRLMREFASNPKLLQNQ